MVKRAKKGSVSVGADKGWLRLSWRVSGKRYYLTLGLPDDRVNRAIAQQKALAIEKDILYNEFDPTLDKYRQPSEDSDGLTAVELFEKYVEFKRQNLDARTIEKYVGLVGHLKRIFKKTQANVLSEDQAFTFRDRLVKELAPITVRERLAMLRSAWEWGRKRRLVTENPWTDVKIKVPPKAKPKPFTAWEIQQIIKGFRDDSDYQHYADVVEFVLSLGCRPGEAFGLKWKHLNGDCSVIWIGESWSRGQQKPTKTNRERAFTLTARLQNMLLERRPPNAKPDDLVFPSKRGKPIDDHNFRNRAWKTVLKRVNIPYRKPYNTRHSFVSHAIDQGLTPAEVSELTGHSEETIFRNYLGSVKGKVTLPELWDSEPKE